MLIDTLHREAGSRQPLTEAPTAALQWHAWMRVLALTVVAVGIGLTFSATTAHADGSDHTGHEHSRAKKSDAATLTRLADQLGRKSTSKADNRTGLAKTLESTVDDTTRTISKTLETTTAGLAGGSTKSDTSSSDDHGTSDKTKRVTASTGPDKASAPDPGQPSTSTSSHNAVSGKSAKSTHTVTHKTVQAVKSTATKTADHSDTNVATKHKASSEGTAAPKINKRSVDKINSADRKADTNDKDTVRSQVDAVIGVVDDSVKAVDKTVAGTAAAADQVVDQATGHATDRTLGKVTDQLARMHSDAAGAVATTASSSTDSGADRTPESTPAKNSSGNSRSAHDTSTKPAAHQGLGTADPNAAGTSGRGVAGPTVPTGPGSDTVALGAEINHTVLAPTGALVSTLGQARPISHLLDSTTAVLHATTEPTTLVPTVVDTVSELTPQPLRPIVDQTGKTATQVTDPVTKIIERTEAAVDPAVPVQGIVDDVADQVVTPVNDRLGRTVDQTLSAISEPTTRTVGEVGAVVQNVAPLPLPAQPVSALGEDLQAVTDDLSTGVTGVSGNVADGLHAVTEAVVPVTGVVDHVGGRVSTVVSSADGTATGQSPSATVPDRRSPALRLPTITLADGSADVSHQARSAVLTSRTGATATATSSTAGATGDRTVTLSTDTADHAPILRSERFSASVDRDAFTPQLFTPVGSTTQDASGHPETAGETTPVPHSGPAVSFAPMSGTASGSTANSSTGASAHAGGSGAAQPASNPTGVTTLDLGGPDRILWEHAAGIVRTPYDPGFSPD